MIRFGTGDSAHALASDPDGRVTRLSALQGRVGAAVKVREIFVYPRAIEEVVIATKGLAAAQGVVTRENQREVMKLRLVLEPGADADAVGPAPWRPSRSQARIRADDRGGGRQPGRRRPPDRQPEGLT
jgi:phenylacetate-CoA ligase